MGAGEALLDGGTVLAFTIVASHGLFGWPNARALLRLRRPKPAASTHRPFEELVARARAIGPRVRHVEPGIRFAKFDGIRQGYDAVLSELADELGIVHLLGIIAPGPALDRERTRVEQAIERAGVDLGLPLV